MVEDRNDHGHLVKDKTLRNTSTWRRWSQIESRVGESSNFYAFQRQSPNFVSPCLARSADTFFSFSLFLARAVHIKWKMQDVDRFATLQTRICPCIFNICVSHQSYSDTFAFNDRMNFYEAGSCIFKTLARRARRHSGASMHFFFFFSFCGFVFLFTVLKKKKRQAHIRIYTSRVFTHVVRAYCGHL